MQTKAIESSQIKAIGHDPKTNTLRIEFKSGGVYDYANFTEKDFKALEEAKSIGSHFYKHIKPHTTKYPYTKVS